MAAPNDPDGNWRTRMYADMVEFGNSVRAFRLSRGWSQRQLARRVGLSQSGISRLEHGLTPGISFGRVVGLINLMYGKPIGTLNG
jgi:transcriptional regulator with XRE-family HTH domain